MSEEEPKEGPPAAEAAPAAPVIAFDPDEPPDVKFEILGAAHEPFAAQPTMRFELGVSEASGRDIYAISLSAQVNFDPARREYNAETREDLFELFGRPERWPATTKSFLWAHSHVLVHSFSGTTTFGMELPCTADLENVASRYIGALPDGEVPLTFHFTGRVIYAAGGMRVQAVTLGWTTMAEYRLPVTTWKAMLDHHHGDSAVIRLHQDTVAGLAKYKSAVGLHTFDACVEDLLAKVPTDAEEALG